MYAACKKNCKKKNVHVNSFIYIIDIFVQSNFEQINCSSKCKVYMHVTDHFTLQYYLTKLYQSNIRGKFVKDVCHHII